LATLQETDFPARASAVADEIARFRPHAVGLQEVSTVDLTLPPLGVDLRAAGAGVQPDARQEPEESATLEPRTNVPWRVRTHHDPVRRRCSGVLNR
jgi:hypothetical protein